MVVQRATIPTSLEVSSDEVVLRDQHSHAVKVTLKRLNVPEDQQEEIVYAKYVLGSDGTLQDLRDFFLLTAFLFKAHTLGYERLLESQWRERAQVGILSPTR